MKKCIWSSDLEASHTQNCMQSTLSSDKYVRAVVVGKVANFPDIICIFLQALLYCCKIHDQVSTLKDLVKKLSSLKLCFKTRYHRNVTAHTVSSHVKLVLIQFLRKLEMYIKWNSVQCISRHNNLSPQVFCLLAMNKKTCHKQP